MKKNRRLCFLFLGNFVNFLNYSSASEHFKMSLESSLNLFHKFQRYFKGFKNRKKNFLEIVK